MTTAVLLAFADGKKEFVPHTHVHGYRDGQLLLATGAPGGGLDAQVVREVATSDLSYVETCERDDDDGDSSDLGPDWSMTWPDR